MSKPDKHEAFRTRDDVINFAGKESNILFATQIAWNDGDGMYARVVFCNYRQKYIIEGLRM